MSNVGVLAQGMQRPMQRVIVNQTEIFGSDQKEMGYEGNIQQFFRLS